MHVARAVLGRDLRQAWRTPGDSLLAVLFFVTALTLFPLGVGPSPDVLARIASGTLWVLALLSVLLTLDQLWQEDARDGSLDLLIVSGAPLTLTVLAKTAAHWISSCLPLIVLSPVLALLLNLRPDALPVLVISLALGTPSLALIGGIGAALLIGSRRGGVLIALLVLPLYVPILIFGVGAVEAAANGLPVRPHLLLLGAILLGSLALAPIASAAALRVSQE
ncbi:heme exporter protein CcmB [Marinivivus vitaminiproducens]|uniref:heme exporter protein CcmB n=1 Tax=Marinivivus vitaminiproducens TaxID=3035935 RepID=UPI0027A5A0BC|nr:heme exporter protein CcmB [Geminicoccaceae bacterium SCSIO 64248]